MGRSKQSTEGHICCIGHITHDRVVTPEFTAEMPGGTAYYFAKALHGIAPSESFSIVTSVGPDEMPVVEAMQQDGINVVALPGTQSVFFENRYGHNMDDRTQRVLAKAAPFTIDNLKSVEASFFHLGTLLADDFSTEVIRDLSKRGKVSVDIQGFLRRVDGNNVVHQDFHEKCEIMPYINVLKANEHEMEVLTGSSNPYHAAAILEEWGCREVVLTFGSKGSLILANGVFHEIPAFRPHKLVDATGCGDTYMAGYLYRRNMGYDIESAGRCAAAMCSLKLARKGPLVASAEEIREMLQRFI